MNLLFIIPSNSFNGLNTFNLTIGKFLKKAGHKVSFFFASVLDNNLLEDYKGIGDIYTFQVWGKFDIVFLNTNKDWERYINLAKDIRFIVHGLMDQQFEVPDYPFTKVFCLSSVAKNCIKTDSKKILIEQPIDIHKFKKYKPVNRKLKSILILDSRQSAFYSSHIMTAASQMGLYVSILGLTDLGDTRKDNVEKYINEADLVIAYGRSALEAMACGRPCIIFGNNGGDGYVDFKNYEQIKKNNFSGWALRTLPKPFEVEPKILINKLTQEFQKYNKSDGIILKAAINKYNNPRKIALKMIQ